MMLRRTVFAITTAAMLATAAGCAADTSADETAESEENLTRTPDERAVIAAVRAYIEPTLNNQKTLLNFQRPNETSVLRVKDGFAFVVARMQLASGGDPSIKGTVYEQLEKEGVFDGFRVESFLKKEGADWKVLSGSLGGTDTMCGADVGPLFKIKMPAGLTECSTVDPAAERKAILDAARAALEPTLNNQSVLFKFKGTAFKSQYKVVDNAAHITAEVVLKNGQHPSIKGTIYEELEKEGVFDGFTYDAILKRENGSWKVVDGALGPTDSVCGADMSDVLGEPMPKGLADCDP